MTHTQWDSLDEESARRRGLYLYSTQHSIDININAHVPGGIRSSNPSKRAVLDRAVPGIVIFLYTDYVLLSHLLCLLAKFVCFYQVAQSTLYQHDI
jgi:hypothetical protein